MTPDRSHEAALHAQGHHLIAGVDEAGRGPLAGPVTAAAVILPAQFHCPELNDSKKLSAAKRERLYQAITQHPDVLWAVASASNTEIDELNILKATHLAMRRAIDSLPRMPDYALVDGLPVKGLPCPHQAIVKGDALSLSIAAASIIAKVTRDQFMLKMHSQFPQYGFARHQGYGTKEHLDALRLHGPCLHHRFSFQPVAQRSLPLD